MHKKALFILLSAAAILALVSIKVFTSSETTSPSFSDTSRTTYVFNPRTSLDFSANSSKEKFLAKLISIEYAVDSPFEISKFIISRSNLFGTEKIELQFSSKDISTKFINSLQNDKGALETSQFFVFEGIEYTLPAVSSDANYVFVASDFTEGTDIKDTSSLKDALEYTYSSLKFDMSIDFVRPINNGYLIFGTHSTDKFERRVAIFSDSALEGNLSNTPIIGEYIGYKQFADQIYSFYYKH